MKRSILSYTLIALVFAWAPKLANAQGMMPRPGSDMGEIPQKEDKPEGPAEAAPEQDKDVPDLPPTPFWPGQKKKRFQFFELDGYFRFRGDMFINLNLGQVTNPPYPIPISEQSSLSCANQVGTPALGGGDRGLEEGDCPSATLSSANIRLRLEPTIRPFGSEWVSVKSQFDVFDNLVLGSTPNGYLPQDVTAPNVPLIAFSDTQAAPVAGRNTQTPAILVKRAWAEIKTPVGILKVGRMPSQWGLGLLANDGSCWDCDFGDNDDRIIFGTKLFNHILAMGYDWAASGPNSFNVNEGRSYYDGQAIDLEDLDDVHQWFWVAGRIDEPEIIKEKVEDGDVVFNYGMYLVWRRQAFDYSANYLGISESNLSTNFLERRAWAVIPDLWLKLLWRDLYLEFEGLLIAGKIGNTSSDNKEDPLDIMQYGWVFKSHYNFSKINLKLALEVGMASGDQSELNYLNRRKILTLQDPNIGDTSLHEFRFDYSYHVDLILFREIMGTVSNATYFKPTISYDIFPDVLGARMDIIYSLAHVPIAYPGNSPHLGVELDLSLYYRNRQDGFWAGLQYGVLFPLAGLSRPALTDDGATFYGTTEGCSDGKGLGCAHIAHTLQANIVVEF